MKKALKIFCAAFIFLFAVGIFLNIVSSIFEKRIGNKYYDEIGDIYGSVEKNQGLILQEKSLSKDDNLLIFGSSELGSLLQPFHPEYFYAGKRDGFQVNIIGRGYSQSLIHTVNMGALGEDLKGKKVVFIISPQWFSEKGLMPKDFGSNFSKYQFYELMFNKDIDKSIKIRLAARVGKIAGEAGELGDIKTFCDLYAGDNILSNTLLSLMMPYYKFEQYLLSINDKIKTDKVLNDYTGKAQNIPAENTLFNWDEEKQKAVEAGKNEASNNEFLIENGYYDMYIRGNISNSKDSYKGSSYTESPEYDDLILFLDICKSLEVKPLVVSVPVNGKWYDYCGFDKKDRDTYYKKLNQIVTSYGFQMADFSGYEYEDYFLKDVMHLGWKGWVYVDEAIDKYYHQDK